MRVKTRAVALVAGLLSCASVFAESAIVPQADNPVFASAAQVKSLQASEMSQVRGTGMSATYGAQGDAWSNYVSQFSITARNYGTGVNASSYYLLAALASSLAAGNYSYAAYYAYYNQ